MIFCGTGATGAIDKLIRLLALDPWDRPVVFIGPYEHHSNELPWRESVADVVTIGQDGAAHVDLVHLEYELRRHADRTVKIGSFSAASNVTGIVTDVDRITITLHRHGALACWDYAAAGPYLPIDMNAAPPSPGRLACLQGRGVHLAPQVHRRSGRRRASWWRSGRCFATAFRRCPAAERCCSSARPGTPTTPIPRSARRAARPGSSSRSAPGSCSRSRSRSATRRSAGASMASPAARWPRGVPTRASRSWAAPNSSGSRSSPSACATPAAMLHANFVVALLSDLFGIQARSGCFCAGPYIHRLSGIDDELSARMQAAAAERAAWAPCSRSPGSASTTSSARRRSTYILDAVHLIADHGWKLLPLYRLRSGTGLWRHRGVLVRGTSATWRTCSRRSPGRLATAPERVLRRPTRGRESGSSPRLETDPPADSIPAISAEATNSSSIRWFPLPGEALTRLQRSRRAACHDGRRPAVFNEIEVRGGGRPDDGDRRRGVQPTPTSTSSTSRSRSSPACSSSSS